MIAQALLTIFRIPAFQTHPSDASMHNLSVSPSYGRARPLQQETHTKFIPKQTKENTLYSLSQVLVKGEVRPGPTERYQGEREDIQARVDK
jgi:hypothetical protein